MNKLNALRLNNPMSYSQYFNWVEELVANGKTTGPNQSEDLIEYTKLNLHRMKRWNKMAKPSESALEKIQSYNGKMTWVVLTEAWCGDAAQNLPYISKLAESNPNIDLKLVLRDDNLDLMNQYLTNGGMSIPKLIAFDSSTGNEIFTWGPRPAEVQEMVVDYKKNHADTVPYMKFSEQVHLWYAKNRNKDIEQELLSLLKEI